MQTLELTPPPEKVVSRDWVRDEIIALCIQIEAIIPKRAGCHVALTGGLLYKDGPRRDADLLFYRIRQCEVIDMLELFACLAELGIENKGGWGWCYKALYRGKKMDLFFPEEEQGEYPHSRNHNGIL